MKLSLVGLHQPGLSFFVEAGQVAACQTLRQDQVPPTAVPASALWQEQQMPLPQDQLRLLTLKTGSGSWQLAFYGQIEFIELHAEALFPLPALMEARKTWPAIKALVKDKQQLKVLLDASELYQQALAAGYLQANTSS